MHVRVNRRGYETDGEKRAVLQSDRDHDVEGVAVERTDSGEAVREAAVAFVGGVDEWGDGDWRFWTVTFDDLTDPGSYRLVVTVRAGTGAATREVRSPEFEVGDHLLQEELLSDVLFGLKAQRSSGVYDRADRDVAFVGDREGTVDVHGGWYDASGDMSKYLSHLSYANYLNPQQTPAVVWGLLAARAFLRESGAGGPGLDGQAGDLGAELDERLREEALHGADFLVRMHDDAGYFYTTVFDRWSHDPAEREICAYEGEEGVKTDDYEAGYRQGGGMAIAALARASTVEGPGEFGPETYRERALAAFDHLEEHNAAYLDDGTENVIDDYCALLAATELAAVADVPRVREAATARAESLVARQTGDEAFSGWFRADDGDRPYFHAAEEGLPVLALLRYREVVGDADVTDAIRRFWDFETTITDAVANPFGYARQYVRGVDDDEPRDAFFFPHDNESGYWWQGENARIASLAAAAARSRPLVDRERADRLGAFARDQLNWILGANPFGVAMVRGVGPQGPEYHREFRNVPGGVLNGITAGVENESDVAFCPEPAGSDHDHRWRWAEQWLPHTTWFLVALAAFEKA